MSDGEVGVNPDRVAQAATALENLRDVLAANVPIITSTLNSYWSQGDGSPVSLGALAQAQGRAPGDAADMRSRARLAAIAAATPANVHDINGTSTVDIPWSGSALYQSDASAEASALAAAEKSNNRAAIQAILADVQDHVDAGQQGATWLQDFYNQAAPAVANLAQVLHDEDATGNRSGNQQFTILTASDQQILATFGQGLAIADKAGLSPTAVSDIAHAPNLWSAAMLIKYGPNGSAYATAEADPQDPTKINQPSLLSQLTVSVFEAQQNGTLKIPLGAGSLGSLERGGGQQSDGTTLLQDQIANFEPLTSLLQADAQNGAAAMQTLGDSSKMTYQGSQTTVGEALAKELLADGNIPGGGNIWYTISTQQGKNGSGYPYATSVPPGTQGNGNEAFIYNTFPSSIVASFLDAATSGGRGNTSPPGPLNPGQLSAQSAANIINALPSATAPNGSGLESDPNIQAALAQLMTNYRFDLAYSAYAPSPADSGTHATMYGNAYGITLTSAAEQNLMQQALQSPQAFGSFLAQVRGDIGTTSVIAVKTGDTNYLDYESALAGLLERAQGQFHFSTTQQAAAQAAEHQEMASILQAGIGTGLSFIPGGGAVVQGAELLNALSGPVVNSKLAGPDEAATIQQTDDSFYDLKSQIWVSIANALIANHVIPPVPAGQDPQAYVSSMLGIGVTQADTTEVQQLTVQLRSTTDPQERATLQAEIDRLNAQIGNAQNLYNSLIGAARSGIGDQQ